MFASGAPGAAALAAAALFLLAPGEARAEAECGISSQRTITCGNAAYNDGIQYFSSPLGHGNGSTLNVPGRSSGPTTITAGSGSQSAGLKLKATTQQGATVNVGGATGGVPHVVNIVQGASTRSGNDEYNNGIYFWSNRLGAWTTLNVRSGVTIGSASAPMEQHGIRFRVRSAQQSQGRGAGAPTLTSAATIYARRQGIRVHRANGATNDATTITNSGAIFSGVGNAADTNTYRHRPHGILAFVPGTTMTGSLTVTNSGDITLGGPYTGIMMQYWASGAMSLDNSGNIGAVAGQTARQGIRFDFEYWENQSAQAVTLTNSGDITASEYGIRLKKLSGGAVTLTNSGAVTATAEAAQHLGHAIYLAEGVTFGEGRTYAANSGAITVDNSGALTSKNHALYVYLATADDDVELENSGAVTSEDGDGIRIERVVEGEVTVDNSGSASGRDYGIYVGKAERVDFDQSGGTIRGRTGVYLQVTSESADGDTRSTDSSMNHIPVIDVDWTGGDVARGTATDDNGRFAAASAAQVLALDQEAAAVKAMEGTLHYGGPAGIEAHALSWRDVVVQVAKGDDPGDFANNAAQLTAVPTGATAADNVYVAQLRAALDNDDLAVASAVFEAIDSSATSLADVTDAEIVTYLRTDNGATRRLLRNLLAQGLTDNEKAILRAVATNDGVDAALTAAGHTDDTSDDGDYWSLVKALLDRHHLDDVTIDMTAGSIDSRGDGIRAYYATPNDSNGAIEVTLGAGVSVTADGTGIYVANAGGDVTVESGATIRAGTDGIRVVKPGTSDDVTITTTAGSSITATAGAGIYPQDYASHTGDVTITNAGGVTGGTWGIYANRLGSGAVSVTSSGGTVLGRTEPGIFAANKAGESGDVPVNVTGGAVRSEGRNKAAIHAWNRGTGDVTVTLASGTSARSKHAAGVFADLGSAYSTTSQLEVTQGGAIEGRTGVYARVAHGDDAATPTARAAGAQPMIDVTWTGTFSHGTTATVAQNDNDRFAAGSVAEALAFDQEAAAVKALEGTATYDGPHYGGAAGVDAQALSWRDVVAAVAKGDDPGAIATSTAQGNLLSTTHADSERTAILAQFKAALGNADLAVAAAVLTAIDSTATSVSDLSDAEIVTYLSTDDDATRTLLRNVLAQGLSDKEKAVLRAVATNDGLATALADADAAFSTAYKTAVNALLDQYNVGNIEVDMTGGSIAAARGDGIRAWYATPNANNGAITVSVASGASITAGKAGVYVANAGGGVTVSNSGTITAGTYGIYVANTASDGAIEVTVAADASVIGGTAGVYVANAADGLTLARKYTYGFAMGQGALADQAVAVAYNGASLLDQVVTVAGAVTGGTDAGVRLSGGAVIVMADGEVRAGSSGVGILADGAALVYVDGEVWGGAGGAAAVHLKGGGDVTVGLNGRVRANGATNAIQRDGTAGTTTLSLITDTTIPYRDDLLAQVEGSLSGVDSARLREYANGVPTGYSMSLGITSDGMLDTSKLPSRPTSYDCTTGGRCRITQAGTVASRRTGLYAAVPSAGATAASQPLIDVTWSGTFTQGAVSSAAVRIAAATARDALVADREAAAGKAVEETVHWGGPAGIEAHALSWRDVATAVAKGDDPGAIADATAQGNLLSTTHADSQRAAILAQFRAALGNADLAVAAAVLTAIDSSATSVSDLSDAEIVAYLDDDDEATRALLRNILAQGLSDKEKAVLEAVAAGDSAALTTALDDTDAGFSAAYKTAVRALLDRRNVGNVRVRMNAGSIDSSGDGIRAYYATPNANNGGIEVTVAAGASVTADRAGIHVANAGGAVTVTSGGTIRGGTYGIRVDKTGTSGDVTITSTGGSITADTLAGIHVTSAGGAVTVTNRGTVRGGTYGIHVDKTGTSGDVTITTTGGSITADTLAGIHVTSAGGAVTVTSGGTIRAETYGIRVDKTGTSGDVTITSGSITADTLAGIHVTSAGDDVTVESGGTISAETYGIRVDKTGTSGDVTITSGSITADTQAGIHVTNAGGDVTVESGGTISAETYGIRVDKTGTSGDVTITSPGGSITADTEAGIHVANAGDHVTVESGGTIRGGTYGIRVDKTGTSGDVTITAGGSITADTEAGIHVTNAGGDVTVESGGTIRAGTYGIHVDKPGSSGDVTITTTGGSITATATAGIGIWPQDNAGHTGAVTVSNGGDVTAPTWGIYANRLGSGTVSVTNTGGTVLGMTQPGIFAANKLGDASTVTVRVTGGTVRSEGPDKPAIRARNSGTGDVTVTIGAEARAVSKHAAGVFATLGADADNDAGQIAIAQGGTIMGRTGVYARVGRASAADETRAAADQPLIDVTWTGTFSHGTTADVAPNDQGRFQAASARDVLPFDRESAAVKVVEATTRWGAPAGIEAHALSWRDVAAAVAKGDDPGEIADNTAQLAAVPTGATASDNAYVAAFRAALGNADLAVAAAVWTAIGGSGATSLADVTDAEIVTYLQTDDAPTRALLRNVLAQGLSDKEKAVLAAVAVGDATALIAALNDADAGFPSDYKAAVQALLERYNVGDVRIAMNEGSIDSRGDGIRAYYATPHDLNGGISVTVAEGASVTAGLAGVYAANAGGDVTVTSGGTIDAGAYGIRVVKPGTSGDVTITTGGSITADLHGVYPQDNAGHTGTVTVTNGGDVTAGLAGVYVNRLGSGAVTVTNTGGTVRGETEPGLFAANKAGDASDVTVNVTGGEVRSTGLNSTVRSTGWNSTAIHAWNRGTGDVTVTLGAEAGAVSKHAAGVFATLGADADNDAGRIAIAQGGAIMGRTGVYALAAHGTTAETVTPRAAADQPLIDVTWTGTFSHGTEADVAPDDLGRFEAATAAEMLVFDRETAAVKAVEESVRWGAPAGIEAQATSWRAVAATVATGDDPGTIADQTARELVFDTRPTATDDLRAKSNALVRQVKAMLDNEEIVVEEDTVLAAFIDAMDTTDDDVYTEEEIAAYLATDDDNIREGLQAVMALGLSEGEKAVLAAVAAGDDAGLDAALTAAGFTDDPADDEDYWSRVKALLERYNVGDVRVAMNGGSIDSRGDGIRAWYATPHADNGGIRVTVAEGASVAGALAGVYVANAGGDVTVSNRGTVRGGTYGVYAANAAANGAIEVTVAAGASVTGGTAGVYAANAGPGLTLARKYTPGFAEGEDPDELVAVMHGEGEEAAPLRNQLVTVAGTVTGGTDAAVRLSGGGAVLVMEGGRVHAGASGVGILVNDPGPALAYVDGEVKGGPGGTAAVHLTGGGGVVVGLSGKVQANGAARAIRSDGTEATTLTLVTDRLIPYREDVNARVEGSLEGVESARLREDRDGAPTGYSASLTVTADGVLDTSKLPSRPEPLTEPPFTCPEAADGRCRITRAGTISGRTGVYAAVPRASASGEPRAASARPLIDVTWTGTFSHAEGDRGRFAAASAADVVAFDRESAAGKAVEETVRWDAPAGIEAHALSWRDVAAEVAKGDDPGAIADAAAQTALLATSGAASRRADVIAQFRAALANDEIEVASAVLTAIDTTATTVADLSDREIVEYLGTDDDVTRALLRNVLAQGLSDAEKAVLRAAATNTGLDDALDDTDTGFTDAYRTAVRALLDRYNVGNVSITVERGSVTDDDVYNIDSRGDGIRAYYATPHDMNGGISVTVAEGASVTGARAGIYVANAGEGLTLARKYTPGYAPGDAPDELVAVMRGEGADAVALRNQLVTVAGTVTGGTDAAVHLSGGGAVLVMEGGKVHAGASGVGILVNDPGPAVVHVDGEVKGGEGGAAAVHLTGGGDVIVGLNGKVEANGAARAIRGGGDEATMVALTLVTDGMIEHREDAEAAYARVVGSTEDVEGDVRFREDRNGVPTGYSTLMVTDDGMLDTSGLPLRPCPEGQTRGADDVCAPTPSGPTGPGTGPGMGPGTGPGTGPGMGPGTDPDVYGISETIPDDNGGIRVTVAAGTSVTGARAGVYVANAGPGLRLARKYTPGYKEGDDPDEVVAVTHGEGADKAPLRNQLVTVAGTVIGGTVAAVHLSGGGAVLVMEGGRVHAGASGVGILVNDPGPALAYVDGEVKGGAGGAAAVHLTGGGSVVVGLNGSVQANGADHAIRGGGDEATKVALTVVTKRMIKYREDAEAAYARVEGSLEDVDEVRFREDRNGVPTGYSTLMVTDDGMLDTSGLPLRPGMELTCEDAGDGRCGLYEALPSMLLEMNGLPSWAERTSAERDANGGWARVESARGKWRAKKAAMGGELAYDHRRSGVRAGFDFLAGENGRVGVSAHALGGKAQMSGVGEVELDGMGGGVSATWLAGDLYVDAQAGLTLYDVGVESYTHGELLKKDVDGAGYALSVDVGARMPVGRVLVTPRGGLSWSKAGLDDFLDMEAAGGPRAPVSVEGARSVKGRLGVMVETELGLGGSSGRLFGSLDVERELSDETEVKVGGQLLETEVRPASVRVGAGGVFEVDENVVVRATAGYRTSGSGTSGYGGGLELHVRF